MDKKLFSDVSYGMYVVTVKDENKNVGCIINTFTQITSEDPTISISLNKNNYTSEIINKTKKFAVSILSEKTSKSLISTFGFSSSKDNDKFIDYEFNLINDIPILKENTVGYFLCEVLNVVDCNTHNVIIAKVIDAKKEKENLPMTYRYYKENLKGFSPKNAPTYVKTEETSSEQYICQICGYVHDGELPEDYVCPICGVDKSLFKKA